MLIRDAELDFGGRRGDVRVAEGRVAEIAPRLSRRAGETVVTAGGCALLPSLCDHHLHLKATAAARASVDCADAACPDATALAERLQAADRVLPAGGWLRGNGFHEHVLAGSGAAPDRDWLDRVVPHRPARLQHRSGRMWLLNTAALRAIGVDEDDGDTPLERRGGRFTGRLYDADGWLRARTGARRPDLGDLSRALWALGVTAVTDCSHDNDRDDVAAFGAAQRSGALLQDVLVMGNADLDGAGVPADGDDGPELAIGARKFHLHDAALPDLDELTAAMRAAHAAGRNVAAHCVSRVDLAFALAAWRAAGARPGDRVEHASVAPPEALAEIAALGLTVVSQPAMISERGAVYRREVDADDLPHLYRLRSFQVAGVPLALSSDAPYTDIDPWRAMAAAVTRRCADGEPLGPGEALSPERAYAAMAGRPSGPGRGDLRLRAGMRADLCLLDRDWAAARADLGCVRPRRAWRAGADNYHLNGVGHGAPACAP